MQNDSSSLSAYISSGMVMIAAFECEKRDTIQYIVRATHACAEPFDMDDQDEGSATFFKQNQDHTPLSDNIPVRSHLNFLPRLFDCLAKSNIVDNPQK